MSNKSEHTENNNIQQFVADLKEYAQIQSEYFQVTAVQKITKLMSKLLFGAVVLVLGIFILFYLLFALVFVLEPTVGFAMSFVLVALIFLILLILIWFFRKKLIVNPLMRMMIDVFYDKPKEKKEEQDADETTV